MHKINTLLDSYQALDKSKEVDISLFVMSVSHVCLSRLQDDIESMCLKFYE